MTFPPPVLAVRRAGDAIRADLLADPSLPFWGDHFPRIGLLPGVVQLHWAIQVARTEGLAAAPFFGLRALKFVNPILSGTRLSLDLDLQGTDTLRFRYHGNGHDYSSGRILFGTDRDGR